MRQAQTRSGGIGALLGRLFGHPEGTLVRGGGGGPEPEDRWELTGCRMCGNKAWCTARVRVRDGVVVEVEGDPTNPVSQGKLCGRGQAAVFNLYNPCRVKAPMKRTNPRKGLDQDPGWVEISWEEALSTVAERLKKIREEDPRKFAHMWGFGGDWWIVQHEAFLPAFGTPQLLRSHGVLCPVHYGCSLIQGTMLDKQDVEYCRYLLTIGGTLGPNIGSSHSTRALSRARERGMKIVVVDPRCSHEATMADEWVPIRPGTDLAFSLSMLNVVNNEIGVFDERFLKRRTNASATIRRLSREFVDAARIGETIVLDGFEFPFRPAIVKGERGSLGKRGGAYQHLVNKMLCMLVGALDVPGGDQGSESRWPIGATRISSLC